MSLVIDDPDIGRRNLSLPREQPTRPVLVVMISYQGCSFLIHACSWFDCKEDDITLIVVYNNGDESRVEVAMEHGRTSQAKAVKFPLKYALNLDFQ